MAKHEVSPYRQDENFRPILEKVLEGQLEAVRFIQSSPINLTLACLIWQHESQARTEGKASVIDPLEFYLLTEVLVLHADQRGIEVSSPLWDFYDDTTENPSDDREDHRRKEGPVKKRSFDRADICIRRLLSDDLHRIINERHGLPVITDVKVIWSFAPGKATYKGKEIPITGIDWKLLKALVDSDKPLTSEDLADVGWQHDEDCERKTIRTHLSQIRGLLRRKLGRQEDFDPIPRRDRGELLAWELNPELR
jgi:hypothetical protein